MTARLSSEKWPSLLFGFVAALCGGLVFASFKLPLPWMLGPIVFVASAQLLGGGQTTLPTSLRSTAQVGLGVAIGLTFVPEVVQVALRSWWLMLAAGLGSLVIGWIGTWFFCRVVRLDMKTSYFSASIGGAWEMYHLAERYGAQADMVSAAHVLRISMVVLIVPTAFALAGIHGDFEQHLGSHADFSLLGLVVLLAVGTATALIATRLRIPNGWVLGPLLTTAFFTGAGVTLSSMPKPLVWGAQLLMGWSMGSKFTRRFFMVKPWFLLTVAVYTAGALALSAGMALAMANLTDRHNASAVLGFVPGGVAEMALTAAALHLEVPLVTTLHLIRVVTAALLVGLIFQVWIEPRLRTKVQHQ